MRQLTWFLCGAFVATAVAAASWPKPVPDVTGPPRMRDVDWSLPVRDVDRAWAVEETCRALLDGRKVWIDGEYKPLPGYDAVARIKRRYFVNKTSMDDAVFRRLGFAPLSDVVVSLRGFNFRKFCEEGNMFFTVTSVEGEGTTRTWFRYYYSRRDRPCVEVITRRSASSTRVSYWMNRP